MLAPENRLIWGSLNPCHFPLCLEVGGKQSRGHEFPELPAAGGADPPEPPVWLCLPSDLTSTCCGVRSLCFRLTEHPESSVQLFSCSLRCFCISCICSSKYSLLILSSGKVSLTSPRQQTPMHSFLCHLHAQVDSVRDNFPWRILKGCLFWEEVRQTPEPRIRK